MQKIEPIIEKKDQVHEPLSKVFLNLLVCTFQMVFGYICLDLCVAISLHYITQEIGSIANAGYGLAQTCLSILIVPVGFGLNQSLNMHTSQALGDQKITLSKRYFNINFFVMLFLLIPLGVLLLGILKYPLSLTIREDRDETASYAFDFLCYLIPAIILALEFEGAKIYMIAHKITYPFIFIHFITFGFHWFITWLLVVEFQMGVFGAGITIVLTEICNIIGLLLFIQFTDIKVRVFKGTSLVLDVKKFRKLGMQYIKTSIPIVLHIFSEFFVFFLLSFIALSLGTPEMNAHLGLQSICGMFFRIPISLSIALMSFVGTEMGRGDLKKAKTYVAIGLLLYSITTLMCSLLLWFLREQLALFYSSKDSNQARTEQLFIDTVPWLIGGMIIVDGLQGTLSGALKGINLISLVFYSTIIAYYIICIPIVSYFTYSWGLDQNVLGIWQGFGVANLLLAILYLCLLFITDWQKQSIQILNRVKRENELQYSTLNSVLEEKLDN